MNTARVSWNFQPCLLSGNFGPDAKGPTGNEKTSITFDAVGAGNQDLEDFRI